MANIAKNGPTLSLGLRMVKPRPHGSLMEPTRGEPLPRATSRYPSAAVTPFTFGVTWPYTYGQYIAKNGPRPTLGSGWSIHPQEDP